MTYQPHQSEDLTTRPVARVGDRLCVKVQNPTPRTITMILATPESAAYANELLADPSSGWKLDVAAGVALPGSRSTVCEHQCAEEQVGGTRCKIVCGVVELPPMDAAGVGGTDAA